MSETVDKNRKSLENLLNSFSDNIYADDEETLKTLIKEEGIDIDVIEKRILNSIKKIKMQIQAQKTKNEMLLTDNAKQKAIQWVDSLLSKFDFSFSALIKKEGLSISFRNMESLSKEEMKNILIKHFTLKFLQEQKKNNGL
jgi:hypothetical protein